MKSDRSKITKLLKTARGQIDGLLRMVEEDRYCIDISNQLLATEAILRKVNKEILHDHIDCCVENAFTTDEQRKKIVEIKEIVDKLSK